MYTFYYTCKDGVAEIFFCVEGQFFANFQVLFGMQVFCVSCLERGFWLFACVFFPLGKRKNEKELLDMGVFLSLLEGP